MKISLVVNIVSKLLKYIFVTENLKHTFFVPVILSSAVHVSRTSKKSVSARSRKPSLTRTEMLLRTMSESALQYCDGETIKGTEYFTFNESFTPCTNYKLTFLYSSCPKNDQVGIFVL